MSDILLPIILALQIVNLFFWLGRRAPSVEGASKTGDQFKLKSSNCPLVQAEHDIRETFTSIPSPTNLTNEVEGEVRWGREVEVNEIERGEETVEEREWEEERRAERKVRKVEEG